MSAADKLPQALRAKADHWVYLADYAYRHKMPDAARVYRACSDQVHEAIDAHEAEKAANAAPVAVPLTDEEKQKMWHGKHLWRLGGYESYLQGIEDAERAHGISVKLEGGEA